jgi:hypothetical protein
MQRAKRVVSMSKVFPNCTREPMMVSCKSQIPVLNRYSDLTNKDKNEARSVIDRCDDDLFKMSAIDLESLNGEPTPNSVNLNDLNLHDLSLLSVSS